MSTDQKPAAGPPRVIRIYNPQLDRIKSGQNNSAGVHRPPFKHYELDPSYWDNFTEFVEAAYADELKRELEREKQAKKFRSDLDHETFMRLRAERDQLRKERDEFERSFFHANKNLREAWADLDRHKRALSFVKCCMRSGENCTDEEISRILEGGE